LGDLLIVGGGALWAATTLIAKGTALRKAAPEKALGYQVALSIPILGLAAWFFGETITRFRALALSLMALSGVLGGWTDVSLVVQPGPDLFRQQIVGLTSSPLFGVVASYFIMHDTLTRVRREALLGDRGALSRQQVQSGGVRAEGYYKEQKIFRFRLPTIIRIE